ncbi:hypothetical protein SAMN05216388_102530 [Halorientalis persicus]|uniref:DeoxyPurine in DNA protein A domain-containing protein n=1 Tax=Halorientalis persicus TaxID=1367881 RepID=A0A1H8U284_9EURY|nr:zinc ribbon domain-containing protein [Halorientalis persicus]SEO97382.1 hypothetical protein SAMN05216388_102530 [Halorientalis persicus]
MPSPDELDFVWTVSSGSSRKALRALSKDDHTETLDETPFDPAAFNAPEYAMVSYATKMNEPWDGPSWILDSGGYSTLSSNPEYETSISDYITFIEERDDLIEHFALRDWACEPDLLRRWDRSVTQHQQWTLRDHIETIEAASNRGLDADPVAVLQGYDVREYLEHLDLLQDHGLITDKMGIGSVCRRGQTERIRNTVLRVRDALPSRVDLHGFGVKQTVMNSPDILAALDSVDSNAWDSRLYYDATTTAHEGPKHFQDEWVNYRKPEYPSFNWVNMLIAYRDYRRDVDAVISEAAAINPDVDTTGVTVTSIGDYTSGDYDVDEYVRIKCLCGKVLDPGRPAAKLSGRCRHCEGTALNIWDLQLSNREQALYGPYDYRCIDCGTELPFDTLIEDGETYCCPDCGADIVDEEEVHNPLANVGEPTAQAAVSHQADASEQTTLSEIQ